MNHYGLSDTIWSCLFSLDDPIAETCMSEHFVVLVEIWRRLENAGLALVFELAFKLAVQSQWLMIIHLYDLQPQSMRVQV